MPTLTISSYSNIHKMSSIKMRILYKNLIGFIVTLHSHFRCGGSVDKNHSPHCWHSTQSLPCFPGITTLNIFMKTKVHIKLLKH